MYENYFTHQLLFGYVGIKSTLCSFLALVNFTFVEMPLRFTAAFWEYYPNARDFGLIIVSIGSMDFTWLVCVIGFGLLILDSNSAVWLLM